MSDKKSGSHATKTGMIRRKGYERAAHTRVTASGKKVRVKKTRVPATLMKSVSGKGRVPKSKRVLPKLEKGALAKYGYHDVKHMTAKARHAALKKAIAKKGVRKTYGHVVVAATYVKRLSPSAYKVLRRDVKWLHKKYYSDRK